MERQLRQNKKPRVFVSISAIRQDMIENDDETLAEGTVQSYIAALKKIFVIEDMPAWNPNLRSKTAIRSAETRYFVDPSIAVAALGLGMARMASLRLNWGAHRR